MDDAERVGRQTTEQLLREAGSDPGSIAERLRAVDHGTKGRALQQLQVARGNSFVQGVMRELAATKTRTTTVSVTRSAGRAAGETAIQREGEPPIDADNAEIPLDSAQPVPTAVTEVIGPPAPSSYAVSALSLADVAAQMSARDEAGHVGWSLDMNFTAPKGPVETVTLTAAITLEMPAWTPPATMLPKARAEWNRWYAALMAHEQGHIDLVHAKFDGLAAKMVGQSPTKANQMFAAARRSLTTASAAYDTKTNHGMNTGTIMNVTIEDAEIAEEKRKEDERKAAEKKAAAEKKDAGTAPSAP